jgi:hypothetical protein
LGLVRMSGIKTVPARRSPLRLIQINFEAAT